MNCRPKTVETLGAIVRLHVVPQLGTLAISAVERSHIAALHDRMRETPYQANRTVDTIARMYSLAEAWGWSRRTATRAARCGATGNARASGFSRLRNIGGSARRSTRRRRTAP